MFTRIIITPDNLYLPPIQWASHISSILRNDECDLLHLRLPNEDEAFIKSILEDISSELRQRITLHDYHHLAVEGLAGGIQINGRNPKVPSLKTNIRISKSCHSIDEIRACDHEVLSYVTLSPIFDSISKDGYNSSFKINELSDILPNLNVPVIALGGVTQNHLPLLKNAGFAGAATLGNTAYLFK